MTWTYHFQEAEIDGLYLRNDFDLELIFRRGKWRVFTAKKVHPKRSAKLREYAMFAIWLDNPDVQAQLTTEHDEEQAERTR